MLFRLFVLLALLPLVDLSLLAWLAWQTNWMVTLSVVLIPGVVGAFLVRWAGPRSLRLASQRIVRGQTTADELLDGLFIVIAGVLLISPGLLSDLAGLSLLFPSVRRFVRRRLSRRIRSRLVKIVSASGLSVPDTDQLHDGAVIDVESKPPKP